VSPILSRLGRSLARLETGPRSNTSAHTGGTPMPLGQTSALAIRNAAASQIRGLQWGEGWDRLADW